MHPGVSVANLVQAAIYGAGYAWLRERWGLPAGVALGCCVLQVAAAGALLARRDRWARWASLVCLIGMAALVGMYWSAAQHITEAYGSEARKIGERSLDTLWLSLPWAFFFPAWQALHGGAKALVAPLVALVVPLMLPMAVGDPLNEWPSQPNASEVAEAAFSVWSGEDASIPPGTGPATVLLTAMVDGVAQPSARGDGSTLGEAVERALAQLTPKPASGGALVMDIARVEYPQKSAVPLTNGGGLHATSGVSPVVAWRPNKMGSIRVAPKWVLPRPKLNRGNPTRFDSLLVTADGSRPMTNGWTNGPELTAESALAAALDGGRMLARHQEADGRYAYRVRGPSGRIDNRSYNFPRHAGTTWFLARLAQRTGDPGIIEATQKGLAYMAANTNDLGDGRAYLGDPRRKDGRAWVGTTSLAVLAAVAADHPLALPWGRFIASTVDEAGMVRGEMDRSTRAFVSVGKNPYGQGQTTLAIAALVRAGHDEFIPVLNRLADFMDGDYAPGGVGRLVVLDEHWTCIASLVVKDAIGRSAGDDICFAYLHKERSKTPDASSRIRPFAAAAGGLAEAVVAAAYLDDSHTADALAFGQWFLNSAYASNDASLLPRPAALLGGFRDTPYKLDVQMDGVQHIGCALLGVEALLDKPHPGTLP
ncbi:MAG: hypothetical protein VX944_01665 [Myxococcota bacterium]|nr:hypothetical protein [Myxococcota bacterium]